MAQGTQDLLTVPLTGTRSNRCLPPLPCGPAAGAPSQESKPVMHF